jgi:hypothetical protein
MPARTILPNQWSGQGPGTERRGRQAKPVGPNSCSFDPFFVLAGAGEVYRRVPGLTFLIGCVICFFSRTVTYVDTMLTQPEW